MGSGRRRLVGEVVDGRYEVLRTCEHGGMGLVHRMRHLRWGTDLAVKSPRSELLSVSGFLNRFVAEAETRVSLGLAVPVRRRDPTSRAGSRSCSTSTDELVSTCCGR
ncbi:MULTISPECIES: hypothetical protein [unclassified Streptomyces]|uniref:hypothetical protein n=1 Tax=unclassified Streptomyces TaxID=2593676 RepID=UPI000DC7551E|nr:MULTISPECIES: hypothetical protein [unclassified Streptomyces]AWZ06095.1 hypothetical protein DRB89_17360 [Streptomyces sp. ICC4]AWZ12810.1 hypothetical protein DRB96_11240 [Streptomyces sp. ICC1]